MRFIGATPGVLEIVRVSSLFVVGYICINMLTSFHRFADTPLVLWSPDNALSLLVLLESSLYAPAVFVASFLTDAVWLFAKENPAAFAVSEILVTLNYLGVAILLRDGFGYDFRKANYANVVRLIAIVPAAGALTGLVYCGSLDFNGVISGREVVRAFKTVWIGNSVGMIVLMPAATAIYDLFGRRVWTSNHPLQLAFSIVAITVGLTFLILSAVVLPDSRYLFTLLFLPIIWVGINYGFRAVALTLLATQLILVVSMTRFGLDDFDFSVLQMQMFVLAVTGQLLGAAISDREETTRALRRQQSELARVSSQATTGALAVAFAHEISQPLSSLSGYLHAAKRMLQGRDDVRRAVEVLESAESETRRTREVIIRIREFVATGALELRETDLESVARKILTMNEEEARAADVRLSFEGPERALTARIDRIAIEQALNNLVLNAIEMAHADAPGVRNVWLRVSKYGDSARLEVEDDGPGVSPEMAARLFEPFETTKPRGMGLGLTLAAQVASKHGGQLEWRPRLPQGACFTLELPIDGPGERHD